ncbi:hypothetical protein [Rubripirellula tenax]|nr:hypothetical protein [Rubripirellula tenax]
MRTAPGVVADQFEFCGYDILDSYESLSVLTNCGGFPGVFDSSEVNRYALVDDRVRADDIAERLRDSNPDCPHCRHCSVWSVARYAHV